MPWWSILFISETDSHRDGRDGFDSMHKTYRHYPGASSWAMLFVVRSCMSEFVQSCVWRGRCGAIHLRQRSTLDGTNICMNLYVVGVHGGHDALFADTLADIACLVRRRPFGSRVMILGDWNVDLLPTLSSDPCCTH